MKFAIDNKDQLIDLYENQKKSPYEIAEIMKTYSNKIRRALKYLGVDIRSKGEAQAIAYETGRMQHPTLGKERSEEVKDKISKTLHESWSNLSDEKKEDRSAKLKEIWENKSDADKNRLKELSAEAIRKASREGSKLERFLEEELTNAGYPVILHHKGLLPNSKLEVDLFIPSLKTVIEVDGPSHFEPIWGVDNLQKNIRADTEKSASLITGGYVLIRIKYLCKTLSKYVKNVALTKTLAHLKQIELDYPTEDKRYIEIDVQND